MWKRQIERDEMSEIEITFLDTKVYKGVRFNKQLILRCANTL